MNDKMLLRTLAVLFALLSLSNVTKTLELDPEHALVFLGRRLHGTPNVLGSTLFGAYLATYAYGLWNMRRFALPMGILYAGWVPLNLYLFTLRSPEELETNSLFGLVYMIIAVTVSLGAVAALVRNWNDLK